MNDKRANYEPRLSNYFNETKFIIKSFIVHSLKTIHS